jgi:hypothetical protein
MSGRLALLLVANVLYLAIGVGLLPLLRIAPSRRALLARLPLAYMVGVAATGILAAHLALVDVPLGLLELTLVALVVLFFGLRRVRRAPAEARAPRPRTPLASASGLVGGGALAATLALLVHAFGAFRVQPLNEFDGWAIWAMKARALYDFGGAYGPVFTSATYPPLQHPLLFPSLEAIGFRAMGAFDGTLIHVQLLLLAFGFAGALWSLLRGRVPAAFAGVGVLAVVTAEPVLRQLAGNLADVPLAFLVALGVVGLARWLLSDETWPLVCGALFLGAAAITKSEGAVFALCALVALAAILLAGGRRRLPQAGWAALAVFLILLPWRLFVQLHHLPIEEYRFGRLLSPSYLSAHADRVGPAAHDLFDRLVWSVEWGFLPLLVVAGLAGAVLARRYAAAGFAALWVALSTLGLLLIYWISNLPVDLALRWSAGRTIASIVVGGAALSPILAAEAWRPARDSVGVRNGPREPREGGGEHRRDGDEGELGEQVPVAAQERGAEEREQRPG